MPNKPVEARISEGSVPWGFLQLRDSQNGNMHNKSHREILRRLLNAFVRESSRYTMPRDAPRNRTDKHHPAKGRPAKGWPSRKLGIKACLQPHSQPQFRGFSPSPTNISPSPRQTQHTSGQHISLLTDTHFSPAKTWGCVYLLWVKYLELSKNLRGKRWICFLGFMFSTPSLSL